MCTYTLNVKQNTLKDFVYRMVYSGELKPETGAAELGISVSQLKRDMKAYGYIFDTKKKNKVE